MKEKSNIPETLIKDRDQTLRNRSKLSANSNLLYWYRALYQDQFRALGNIEHLAILEIGSGVSPLSRFYPTVRTSDVLDLEYLDYSFDCHDIGEFAAISNGSLDVITLTNVLHHLKSPIDFLKNAARKLKPGGKLIATEPYFSVLSTLIYKYLHHELVDFSIEKPQLSQVHGPLSSANSALAELIFQRSEWRQEIAETFDFEQPLFRPFTSLSYFATGGISHRIPFPDVMYRPLFVIDLWLSRRLPRFLASFFTVTLTRR